MGKSGPIFCFIAALLLLAIMQTESVSAQIAPGDRVRLDVDTVKSEKILFFFSFKSPERIKVIGELVDMNDTSIYIADQSFPSEVRHFRLNKIRSIYQSTGQRRYFIDGLFLGIVLGAGGGFLLASLPDSRRYDEDEIEAPDRRPLRAAAILGGIGAVLGGTIGWLTHVDKWEKIDKSELSFKLDYETLTETPNIKISYRF